MTRRRARKDFFVVDVCVHGWYHSITIDTGSSARVSPPLGQVKQKKKKKKEREGQTVEKKFHVIG